MDDDDSINIKVPGGAEHILKTIRRAGYEAYFVGGCVRDRLLGKEPGDWDITTSARPEQVKELFRATADTGIKHGTVMVIYGGKGYEITTFRVDGAYQDGRHPDSVTFTPSLEEDLKRRDFTINALAYCPERGLADLFGGLKDLRDGIVRAVGDPRKRFEEDALRIMRAVRFAAQLSFEIEEETLEAISEFAGRLSLVSAERIRTEFEKTLYSDNPSYVNEYRRLGLARYIVPGVWERCFKSEGEDIWKRLRGAEGEDVKILRLAVFFAGLSPEECSCVMRAMTFDNRKRKAVCKVLEVENELSSGAAGRGSGPGGKEAGTPDADERAGGGKEAGTPDADERAGGGKEAGTPDADERAGGGKEAGAPDTDEERERIRLKRLLRKYGEDTVRRYIILEAAKGTDMSASEKLLGEIQSSGEPWNEGMLAVGGGDLLDAGLRGRQVGEKLNELLDEVIRNPELNNREALLKLVRSQ